MKNWYIVKYKELELTIEAEVEIPKGHKGQFENGEIDIIGITLCGHDVFNLVCEIKDWQENIIELIRKQLN